MPECEPSTAIKRMMILKLHFQFDEVQQKSTQSIGKLEINGTQCSYTRFNTTGLIQIITRHGLTIFNGISWERWGTSVLIYCNNVIRKGNSHVQNEQLTLRNCPSSTAIRRPNQGRCCKRRQIRLSYPRSNQQRGWWKHWFRTGPCRARIFYYLLCPLEHCWSQI